MQNANTPTSGAGNGEQASVFELFFSDGKFLSCHKICMVGFAQCRHREGFWHNVAPPLFLDQFGIMFEYYSNDFVELLKTLAWYAKYPKTSLQKMRRVT